MPQVRCPNCGNLINLETRKKTDFDLVLSSLRSGPQTFTQLLHKTNLPRKTLSLRLKELTDRGTIFKDNGYHLSGSSETIPVRSYVKRGYRLGSKIHRFIKENPNGNRDAFITGAFFAFVLLGPLLFCYPFGAYVHQVHAFNVTCPAGSEFSLSISIHDADDLCAWQGKIKFDPNVFVVTNVLAGNFLSDNSLVINATDGLVSNEPQSLESVLVFSTEIDSGTVLIGGSLLGNVRGKSGDGILATVVFNVAVTSTENIDLGLEGDIILLNSDMVDAKGVLSAKI